MVKKRKIKYVLLEHAGVQKYQKQGLIQDSNLVLDWTNVGLPHVLPLTVHLDLEHLPDTLRAGGWPMTF